MADPQASLELTDEANAHKYKEGHARGRACGSPLLPSQSLNYKLHTLDWHILYGAHNMEGGRRASWEEEHWLKFRWSRGGVHTPHAGCHVLAETEMNKKWTEIGAQEAIWGEGSKNLHIPSPPVTSSNPYFPGLQSQPITLFLSSWLLPYL